MEATCQARIPRLARDHIKIVVKKDGGSRDRGRRQVSLGQTVIKGTARKVPPVSAPVGLTLSPGFAGSTADASPDWNA